MNVVKNCECILLWNLNVEEKFTIATVLCSNIAISLRKVTEITFTPCQLSLLTFWKKHAQILYNASLTSPVRQTSQNNKLFLTYIQERVAEQS